MERGRPVQHTTVGKFIYSAHEPRARASVPDLSLFLV